MEGRKIRLYFDDGQKVSWKEGILTLQDEFFITLDNKEIIPKNRIIRMEVLK